MIIVVLLFSFFGGYLGDGVPVDFKAKPIICGFNGNGFDAENKATPVTEPSQIPKECEVILFVDCAFNTTFTCNTDILKAVVGLKKPVLLSVFHDFAGWNSALKPDGNAEETKCITDYAAANGAVGVVLSGTNPVEDTDKADGNIATNIIPYINQLKCVPGFVVGVSLHPASVLLVNPCVFNYEATNDIVDFYIVRTYELNVPCVASVSNMKSPTFLSEDLYTVEDVVNTLAGTKIAHDKTYLIIDLEAADPNNPEFSSYTEVCSTSADTKEWCIPTTKDYYDKAAFIKKQGFGVVVYWIEFDDSLDCCCCGAFIGFQNIIAGYTGGAQKACPKFDVKQAASP